MGVRDVFSQMKRRQNESDRLKNDLLRHNELLLEVRAQRHDFMKHLTAVQFMLEQGQTVEAKAYLDELLGAVAAVNRFIQGEDGHIAGLLYGTYRQADEAGVRVRYLLDAPGSLLPLPMLKQSELLGNLLANSLEAAIAVREQGGEAEIILHSAVRSGLYLLELANTSLPIPGEIQDRLFRSPVPSAKVGFNARRHEGLGTYIVSRLVAQHHGTIHFMAENGRFEVKIKLPILRD
jgi:two-component system, LytTR family, sensor histidine kinase NatK